MLRRLRKTLLFLARDQKTLFGVSFLFGMLLAVIFHSKQEEPEAVDNAKYSYDFAYEKWLYDRNLYSKNIDPDVNRYKDKNGTDVDVEAPVKRDTEAGFLYQTISVVCLVFPSRMDWVVTVRDTWGKHCNHLRFYHPKLANSSVSLKRMPSKSEFGLICNSLHEIHAEVPDYDWVLVSTDDTFVIPENFRYYAAHMNSSETHYLGHAMRFWNAVYNWRDAGYAVSRGSVKKLLDRFRTKEQCESGGKFWKNGDWYLGKHLHELGIEPVDTRDEQGKGRFNGYSFRKLLFPGAVSIFERYWKDSLYLSQDGPQCCSSYAVTFHGILSTSKIYQLEYLFYHLRPFYSGGKYGNLPAPPPLKTPHLSWEEKLKEDELEHMFNSLLTTPPNMMEKHAHDPEGFDIKHWHSHV